MESPSEPQCRAVSPWRGLLITASILSCWIQPTTAQVTVVPNPPYGEVNRSVTLNIQGFSGQALVYTWYRKAAAEPNRIARYTVENGEQKPADIREKVLPNGSLLIPDLTLSDTDTYIVAIVNSRGDIIFGEGHLAVYGPLPKPLINTTNMAPVENKDNVSLTCQSETQDVTHPWFITQSSPAGDRIALSPDNRTLTIINVTREDQGLYKCEIRNPASFSESKFTTQTKSQSIGGSSSSPSGGAITGIVIGVLAGIILIGILIYIQFFRRRASKHQLSEKNHSKYRHGKDATLYENTVHLPGSALPAQGLGSSLAFSEVPPESSYETLDITRVDVYDKINHWKQPEA